MIADHIIQHDPKVTVLMSVYNGERYLKEAVDSILAQSFSDFEFIIINDGSTDRTVSIIESYRDSRIFLVHNKIRQGLPISLNKGIRLARGKYIARMDSDDISLPLRLERQVSFMDANPQVGISGTWIEHFGVKQRGRIIKAPIDHDVIRCNLLFGKNFLAHPTIIMRKYLLQKFNLYYNPQFEYSQDTELWSRSCNNFLLSNLPEVLLKYRIKTDGYNEKRKQSEEYYKLIAQRNLLNIGLVPSDQELLIHALHIRFIDFEKNVDIINNIEQWLLKIQLCNSKNRHYTPTIFSTLLIEHWFNVCFASTCLGSYVWQKYWESSLPKINPYSLTSFIFWMKCLFNINSLNTLPPYLR